MKKIPVTVLSGFLGSGKTTILNHILKAKKDMYIALIVNDMASVNIDGKSVQDKVVETKEKLVQISNGCICCTLREDLFNEVKKIAEEGKYDYLVIEASGISEPLPVAATFTFEMDDGKSLKDVAELDTMVTIVDAHNFIAEYNSAETLKDRKQEVSPEDERTVIDLLIDQLEFANVILVNKADLVSEEDLATIRKMIRGINAHAEIIDTTKSVVELSKILNTKKFDFEKAQEYPTWIQEIQRDSGHTPETEEYGISSFVYKKQIPFHPQRLWDFMHKKIPGLVRAKGYFWLPTRMDLAGNFQLVGRLKEFSVAGQWWAAIPKKEWPDGYKEAIDAEWNEPYGDRRQELVFIGIDFDKDTIIQDLDACLLTKEELGQNFATFPDPFPKWE